MSAECIFCKIIKGDIPSQKVYEDDAAFAFLDIRPLAPGHVLVVPKDHVATMDDLGLKRTGDLFAAVHRVVAAAKRATGAPAATVAVNDGPEAGQEVPHVHVHVVPRTADDGHGPIHRLFGGGKEMDSGRLADLARRMKDAVPAAAR